MFVSWTFGRKLGAGFASAAVVLVVIAVFGYQTTRRLIEDQGWVAHSHEVRKEISDVPALLRDMESAGRGYVISGDESFLEGNGPALAGLEKAYSNLRTLTADNREQQRRLDAARPLIDAKLRHMKENIEERRTQGAAAALRRIADGSGKELMAQLRGLLGEMDREEQALLDKRVAESQASAGLAQGVMMWGSALGILLVAAIGAFISRTLSQQIGAAVRHVQTSSAELQAAANQQATGAREQATAMSEITTTISELLATSRQIAESAQRVAQIAEQTAQAARSGDLTVERGNESMAGIRRQVEVIVNHMLELGRKSQQIGAVLDIVSELAEQTNILAINATIEAAGAGDAGKRFGVVADEIRKLADRVAGSTKEIRGLIDDVRSAVNTTVMTTEAGAKAVEAGARQFAEVATAFGRITSQVTTTTEAAKEIELSTKQQSTAVEQVNVASTNVAQATKETEVSTGQTLQTASQLAVLSRDLLRLVQPEGSPGARPGATG